MGLGSGDERTEQRAPAPALSPGARLVLVGLRLLLVLCTLEVACYAAGRVLRARGLFLSLGSVEGLDEWNRRLDPDVGWPGTGPITHLDASRARISPAFPDPSAPACVALYGDSFTFAEDVGHEEAWGNQLARRLACRVANHGILGFGTDQALLWARRNPVPTARARVLGICTENVLRNVNQFRGLLYPHADYAFKPRFLVADDGNLTLVPLPQPGSAAEYLALLDDPAARLPHEYFLPGGPAGITALEFPFTLSALRLTRNYRLQAVFRREPAHAAFYAPDHPSGALRVTSAIARSFVAESKAQDKHAGVVIFPLAGDFAYARRTGRLPHQPLLDELERHHVPVLDTTAPLEKALGDRDPCDLYVRCQGGHFTPEGNRIIAESVHGWLAARSLP